MASLCLWQQIEWAQGDRDTTCRCSQTPEPFLELRAYLAPSKKAATCRAMNSPFSTSWVIPGSIFSNHAFSPGVGGGIWNADTFKNSAHMTAKRNISTTIDTTSLSLTSQWQLGIEVNSAQFGDTLINFWKWISDPPTGNFCSKMWN